VKKLPLGIQNFREIVEGGYVYVDKTPYIYELIEGVKHYFLSRPRRFGKSLLLDTIAEAFCGDRELFKGLFIYNTDYSFEKHPILRLDMSNIANETPETLKKALLIELRKRVREEGFDFDYDIPSSMYKDLIEAMFKKYGKKVVILIDEYDKPILDRLTDIETAEANRDVLRGFYGVLKSMDPYLRFTFITGVTKFTKTSIFSGLNNLRDITMSKNYSNICGVTIEDLSSCFDEHIAKLSSLDAFMGERSIHDEILTWYDGYSWDGLNRVINPFSLLNFFAEERFYSFWYASGTPKFLISLIKEKPSSFLALRNLEISEKTLDNFDITNMSIVPLLFQTGYLTVSEKRYRGVSESLLMEMPNLEVKEAFNLNIVAAFTESDDDVAETAYWRIKESLKVGDLQAVLSTLRALFASIPYQLHVNKEAYYHSIFLAIMNILGFDMEAEVSTAWGRIDAALELEDKVYVMEFKYEDCPPGVSPDEKQELFKKALDGGMEQICDRKYAQKFEGIGKTVHKAIFAFLGRDDIEMRVELC